MGRIKKLLSLIAMGIVLIIIGTFSHAYGMAASNNWDPIAMDIAGLATITIVRGYPAIYF